MHDAAHITSDGAKLGAYGSFVDAIQEFTIVLRRSL
jgi:hypothetical protein